MTFPRFQENVLRFFSNTHFFVIAMMMMVYYNRKKWPNFLQKFQLPSKTEGSLSIYYELMNGLKKHFRKKNVKDKIYLSHEEVVDKK